MLGKEMVDEGRIHVVYKETKGMYAMLMVSARVMIQLGTNHSRS